MIFQIRLRLANIEYQNEFSLMDRSAKGLLPYITLNGEEVADSQFCIEYLANKLGRDLSENLNSTEKAIARALFKMIEESTRWCLGLHRFCFARPEDSGIPWLIFKIFGVVGRRRAVAQGYGRHTKEEIYKIGKDDLMAIENFVAGKKFLFGDEPCNEDACVFAFLCMFLYLDKGPFNEFLTRDLNYLIFFSQG